MQVFWFLWFGLQWNEANTSRRLVWIIFGATTDLRFSRSAKSQDVGGPDYTVNGSTIIPKVDPKRVTTRAKRCSDAVHEALNRAVCARKTSHYRRMILSSILLVAG